MRAAVRIRNGIGKAERLLIESLVPLQHAIDENELLLVINRHLTAACQCDGLRVDLVLVRAHLAHELLHAFLIEKDLLTLRLVALVGECDLDAGIEEGEFAQAHQQTVKVIGRGDGEDRGVREKGNLRAGGLRIIKITENGQRLRRFATLKADGVDLAIAEDLALEPIGQRIGTLGTDAMQTAGELIRAVAKLAAGMQAGKHQFHRRYASLGMHLNRNATTIILNGDGAVRVDGDPDVFTVACEMLIDGVVHHFKHAVVQAALIGIADVHSRPQPDGFEAFEFLNLIGTVGLVFGHTGIESSILLRRLFGHRI